MCILKMKVLSYHKFTETFNEYVFSRTYDHFRSDLSAKEFDLITLDDASECQAKALEIMIGRNIRCKLFVSTNLVGEKGFMGWEQIKKYSLYHDIENHSHNHIDLSKVNNTKVEYEIEKSSDLIEKHIGKRPRYFVPPWNQYSQVTDEISKKYGMQTIKNRIDIKNITP